jgi:hypothetical protein
MNSDGQDSERVMGWRVGLWTADLQVGTRRGAG